jgi:LPXTG-motif cell wall-anchored protein
MEMPRSLVAAAAVAGSLLSLVAFAPSAAAAGAGWSRSPSAGIAGATIRVASSPTTLCQWLVPTPPSSAPASSAPASSASNAATPSDAIGAAAVGDPIAYDGVRVELRFERDGVALPLGNVPVTSGGAWAGSVTVPAANVAPAGTYDLLAHCVVDDPALDGVHSYDFDPLPFVVVEAPPPTTVTIPTEIDEPVTVTNPVQVQGAQLDHPASANQPAAAAPTLPNTGDGTLTVAIAGFAALFLGGLALWWGARTSSERASI